VRFHPVEYQPTIQSLKSLFVQEADMHRTYLAGIERSLRNPSLENIVKLANALEITLPELFSAGTPSVGTTSRRAATSTPKKVRRR
jgi:transcriptional regulator with XRE-family HTH domain